MFRACIVLDDQVICQLPGCRISCVSATH